MLTVRTHLGPSAIEGIGLFAAEAIEKGQLVWRFTKGFDLHFSRESVEALPAVAKEQILRYAYAHLRLGTYVLCADNARFLNHSDVPNVTDIDFDSEDKAYSVAATDIAEGDELTVDYRKFDSSLEARELSS